MGLTSFKTFCGLPQRFKPKAMGFSCDIGTINRLSARMGLAKSFRGVQLDGFKEPTVRGYNALFRVFLTHSALECFCKVYGYSTKWPEMGKHLTPVIARYNPAPVMCTFRERDRNAKFYEFLRKHTTGAMLLKDLQDCREGNSENVVAVSAAIRHVFAHGILTAHANEMNPRVAHEIGIDIATFLFNVIDAEFTNTVETYCQKKTISSSQAIPTLITDVEASTF